MTTCWDHNHVFIFPPIGHIISNKKEDLVAILDYYNIQVCAKLRQAV